MNSDVSNFCYTKDMLKIPKNAKKVFEGLRSEIYQWEQELFDGTTTTFELIHRASSVTVFAIADGKIIVQKQEQPFKDAPFLCLVGGIVDKGEEPLEAAKRELLEETGYASEDWELWQVAGMRGYIHWENNVYIARACSKISEMKLDAGEKIELSWASLDEFLKMLDDPTFRHKDLFRDLLEIRDNAEKKAAFAELLGL